MDIIGLYAAVTAADMARAEAFYTALFGRGPDDRPMEGLIQWRDLGGVGHVQFHDAEAAGHARMTIVTPVMAQTRAALAGRGLTLGEDVSGDFGIIAQISDPDGNLITLAEPPKGPVP